MTTEKLEQSKILAEQTLLVKQQNLSSPPSPQIPKDWNVTKARTSLLWLLKININIFSLTLSFLKI